jgi:stringent starvation protein A
MTNLLRRSTMTLLSDPLSHYSHRVRLVVAEKGIAVDIEEYSESTIPAELGEINPYSTLPTLIDRDLVLYESRVIMEYLDERFPHPPLLPVYPVTRGLGRLWMYRIERDWCRAVDLLAKNPGDEKATKYLRQSLLSLAPVFSEKEYFMSDEFSLVDCCMAPILWRLGYLGVQLTAGRQSKPLTDYMKRIFGRPAWRKSMSAAEAQMYQAY